jgi:A/G-specific adenine glycosylase
MVKPVRQSAKTVRLRQRLLAWYQQNKRDLPWRQTADPYAVWISEIMLQQTRVVAVIERYQAFMQRFPTVHSLAQAPVEEVLALWSGLGYYRRARMLHQAARFAAEQLQGKLPPTAKELRVLPGIGSYTGAAIASIAFGEPVAAVDGNVERVLCRLSGWEIDSGNKSAVRREVEKLAAELVDPLHPGDFNQAMMELGATVCTPRSPQCRNCPIAGDCETRGEHKTVARPPMQSRAVAHALAVRSGRKKGPEDQEVLLEQRPAELTVMPGLWELPALRNPAVPEEDLRMTVRHAIMQVNYIVRICSAVEGDVAALTVPGGKRRWVPLGEAGGMALTGLARKVLTRAHLLPAASPKVALSATPGKGPKTGKKTE